MHRPEHSKAVDKTKVKQPTSSLPKPRKSPTAKPSSTLGAAAFPVRKASPAAAPGGKPASKPVAAKPAHHKAPAGKEPSPETVFSNHMRTLSVAEREGSSDSDAVEVVRQPRLLQGANKTGD